MTRKLPEYVAPLGSIPVRNFSRLDDYLRHFARGGINFLLLLGMPGLSKTRSVQAILADRPHLLIDNVASAFELYRLLYLHRDEPVVIDDLDGFCADRGLVRLLKPLCGTEEVKTLRWHTNHPRIGPDEAAGQTPAVFQTRSRVIVIANEWLTLSNNVRAIEDRAIRISFQPDAYEVHAEVKKWFDNPEVYDFIGEHLELIPRASMRPYRHGKSIESGITGWQRDLLSIMELDEPTVCLLTLLRDGALDERQRIERFAAEGHGSRATYFRVKRRIQRRRGGRCPKSPAEVAVGEAETLRLPAAGGAPGSSAPGRLRSA